jgi:hypothetical protein
LEQNDTEKIKIIRWDKVYPVNANTMRTWDRWLVCQLGCLVWFPKIVFSLCFQVGVGTELESLVIGKKQLKDYSPKVTVVTGREGYYNGIRRF